MTFYIIMQKSKNLAPMASSQEAIVRCALDMGSRKQGIQERQEQASSWVTARQLRSKLRVDWDSKLDKKGCFQETKRKERERKKSHTPPEILTDAFKCIERFTCLVENLTIIISVHIISQTNK